VRFVVRSVSSLAAKDAARRAASGAAGVRRNPFLPYEPELWVATLTPTHVALLNKFSVIDHHLLIVTRRFEHQETLLGADDFLALAACLREIDGLSFYNGGAAAGASQPHKHLQLVPLPLADGSAGVPIEAVFAAVRGQTGTCVVPGLPFRHGFAWCDEAGVTDVPATAQALRARYQELLAAVNLHGVPGADSPRQSAPYNLLATRRWMLLVRRAHEHFETLSINALAYAGALFVRNDAELEILRRAGPMRVLRAVAVAPAGVEP
jgi:ATP adenylyltransferase